MHEHRYRQEHRVLRLILHAASVPYLAARGNTDGSERADQRSEPVTRIE